MAEDVPGGFTFETFDVTAARVSQSHIASRLTAGPKDESGRFRVAKGMSSLNAAEEDVKQKTGVTLMDPTKAVSCDVVKRKLMTADAPSGGGDKDAAAAAKKAKKSTAEDGEEKEKEKKKSWLANGLVVKILDKSLKEAGFFKKKGIVRRVHHGKKNSTTAEIEILGGAPAVKVGTGDGGGGEGRGDGGGGAVMVRVSERDVETVLPAPGRSVRIVKGDMAGATGELRRVHESRFLAEVALDAADGVRQRVEYLQYDEVCKVHDAYK